MVRKVSTIHSINNACLIKWAIDRPIPVINSLSPEGCGSNFTYLFSNVPVSSLQWRQNERDGVSNHKPHDCLLNRYSDADQRNHQSSASLAFVRGIHRGPVNSPHKGPVTRKMFPFDDVIMSYQEVIPHMTRPMHKGIKKLNCYFWRRPRPPTHKLCNQPDRWQLLWLLDQ